MQTVWERWKADNARQWAFLCGRTDVVQARKWGFVMAAGMAGLLAALVAARLLGLTQSGLGPVSDPRVLLAAAGLFLVLGALAAKGKAWASMALMALWVSAAGLVFVILCRTPATSLKEDPWLWPWGPIQLGLATAIWMRIYYVVYRAERREAHRGARQP
jgi:hypothetical protein